LNYGAGLNSKLFFNLDHGSLGRLEMSVFGYVLWSYPGTSAISRGTVSWIFADLTYSYPITLRMSLGFIGSLAFEWGKFGNFPDIQRKNRTLKTFVAWNF